MLVKAICISSLGFTPREGEGVGMGGGEISLVVPCAYMLSEDFRGFRDRLL